MEHELKHVYAKIARGKLALFAIVGFLSILTYLTVVVSQQVASEQSNMDLRSEAALRSGGLRVNSINQRDLEQMQTSQSTSNTYTAEGGKLTFAQGSCGQDCATQASNKSPLIQIRECGPGLSCEPNPYAPFSTRKCYPAGQYGKCDGGAVEPPAAPVTTRGTQACSQSCTTDTDCAGTMKCVTNVGKGISTCQEYIDCSTFCSRTCDSLCAAGDTVCLLSCNNRRDQHKCDDPSKAGISYFGETSCNNENRYLAPGCCINTGQGQTCNPL